MHIIQIEIKNNIYNIYKTCKISQIPVTKCPQKQSYKYRRRSVKKILRKNQRTKSKKIKKRKKGKRDEKVKQFYFNYILYFVSGYFI